MCILALFIVSASAGAEATKKPKEFVKGVKDEIAKRFGRKLPPGGRIDPRNPLARMKPGPEKEEHVQKYKETIEQHRKELRQNPRAIMNRMRRDKGRLNDLKDLDKRLAEEDDTGPVPISMHNFGLPSRSSPPEETIDVPIKYKVLRVSPTHCRGKERADIAVHVSPSFDGVGYCRFNETIVRGRVRRDGKLHCKSPEHPAGWVKLAVAVGTPDEYMPVSAGFVFDREPLINWNYVILPVGVAVCVVVLLLAFAYLAPTKTRKRRKRTPAALRPGREANGERANRRHFAASLV